MILIGLGANQFGPWGDASESVSTAIEFMRQVSLTVDKQSSFYISAPMGGISQSNYVNMVISVRTHLPPKALMMKLHAIEKLGGRKRGKRWGSRTLDLDLLDWNGVLCNWPDGRRRMQSRGRIGYRPLVLPHPGIGLRQFVLVPIAEIAPNWHHPVLHQTAGALLKRLKTCQGGQILT